MLLNLIEVSFKRNRKIYCSNKDNLDINIGDYVVIEVEKGFDLGQATAVEVEDANIEFKSEPPKIVRKASENDMQRLDENRKKEDLAFTVCREKIQTHSLYMKLVDVEFQMDENKITFFFTSDRRVDFRNLVKDLAAKYRTRIELRQIGVREEAKKIGGLGICGECLCCATFMNNFSPISTQDAKNQNLPMNPTKLSGTCGRLKCCMLYEKEFYANCLKKFPALDTAIETDRGIGYVDRVDIFNDSIMLRFEDDEFEQFSLTDVNALIQLTNPVN
jgi:cell fate regulator YaaT (PSP1 superfamily)